MTERDRSRAQRFEEFLAARQEDGRNFSYKELAEYTGYSQWSIQNMIRERPNYRGKGGRKPSIHYIGDELAKTATPPTGEALGDPLYDFRERLHTGQSLDHNLRRRAIKAGHYMDEQMSTDDE